MFVLMNLFCACSDINYIQNMQLPLRTNNSYASRPPRTIDNISQVSNTTLNPSLKPIQLYCSIHPQQFCQNYCIEHKCFQPLCSQCIQDHLLHHKRYDLSDLGVKSIRSVRKQCVNKLAMLIDQLMRRLGMLQAPPNPEQLVAQMDNKVQQIKKEAHQIIEEQFNRINDMLRVRISQTASSLKSMAQIHNRLETIIQQLKETHFVLCQGKKTNVGTVPECIRKTLTLNDQALLESFDNEGLAYESKRKKFQFDVLFNPQALKNSVLESVKIVATNNSSGYDQKVSRVGYNSRSGVKERSQLWESDVGELPFTAQPQQNNKLLHFFETGTNKLHLVDMQGRRKGQHKIIQLNQFIVPAFHSSLVSNNSQFIYLSGGIVEIGHSKSPLFVKYNVRTQQIKRDFARVIPRSSHTICQHANGDVYILGGYGQQQHKSDPLYLKQVQRINQKTGRVQYQADSNWGGSNIAFKHGQWIVKACQQGIQLFNNRNRQWVIADIRLRNRGQFCHYKNAGYASLRQGQYLIFGGYRNQHNDLYPNDECHFWKISGQGQKITVVVTTLKCKLPIPDGFDNGKAVVDQHGFYVLQNVQDDEETCLDNQRRLLRFQLNQGGGEWKVIQKITQE